jgi:hypothetical protein
LRGGDTAGGIPFDYSGNIVTNNIVDGIFPSTILENAQSGGKPASYSGNKCMGACLLNVYH